MLRLAPHLEAWKLGLKNRQFLKESCWRYLSCKRSAMARLSQLQHGARASPVIEFTGKASAPINILDIAATHGFASLVGSQPKPGYAGVPTAAPYACIIA